MDFLENNFKNACALNLSRNAWHNTQSAFKLIRRADSSCAVIAMSAIPRDTMIGFIYGSKQYSDGDGFSTAEFAIDDDFVLDVSQCESVLIYMREGFSEGLTANVSIVLPDENDEQANSCMIATIGVKTKRDIYPGDELIYEAFRRY